MKNHIAITIPDPFITLDEFCRRTGIPKTTARDMISDGRLPVMPKPVVKGRVVEKAKSMINMVALTLKAADLGGYSQGATK